MVKIQIEFLKQNCTASLKRKTEKVILNEAPSGMGINPLESKTIPQTIVFDTPAIQTTKRYGCIGCM